MAAEEEAAMTSPVNRLFHHAILAAALSASVSFAIAADDGKSAPLNPGFTPSTGQINPGSNAAQPPAGSPPGEMKQTGAGDTVGNVAQPSSITNAAGEALPTPEETRAALMTPGSKDPSAGPEPVDPHVGRKPDAAPHPDGDVATRKPGEEQGSTTGKSEAGAAAQPIEARGPIGATGHTMPSKYSERNAIIDRTRIVAYPKLMTDEERRRIYAAVMAEKTQPASGAARLEPASELPAGIYLNDMHEMPASVANIEQLKGYKYVKSDKKVLLVNPTIHSVRDVITE
jgi:hypothetical protein